MVQTFVDAGMKVVLADIDEEKLKNTVALFKDLGAKVLGVAMDVSQPEQVKSLAEKTLERFGEVSVLCNNAGVGYGGRNSWTIPLEAWR